MQRERRAEAQGYRRVAARGGEDQERVRVTVLFSSCDNWLKDF